MRGMNGKTNGTKEYPLEALTDRIIAWIGSLSSLVVHTVLFAAFFVFSLLGVISWGLMLLILTTVVSLEAIYLAIFIQMTVNRHSTELEEVSEDIDEIQEDMDEIQEDVDEIQEDIDEIQEDVDDIQEDDVKDAERREIQLVTLAQLTKDVQRVLRDLETFKKQ